MHRFFVPLKWLGEDEVTIAGPIARRMGKVLRVGDRAILLDNSGWEHEVEVSTVGEYKVVGLVVRKSLAAGEPRTKVSLYQGVLDGKRFKFALQRGTELGVVEFVPLICGRCVIADLGDISAARFRRWRRAIREAAERSGRGRLPSLQPAMLFPQACEQAGRRGLSIILCDGGVGLRSVLRKKRKGSPLSVNIFVGPEEGFTPEEVEQARMYGLIPIAFGPRILRAEMMGIVAATAILYELGDLE